MMAKFLTRIFIGVLADTDSRIVENEVWYADPQGFQLKGVAMAVTNPQGTKM